jgi:hypothetical protein
MLSYARNRLDRTAKYPRKTSAERDTIIGKQKEYTQKTQKKH